MSQSCIFRWKMDEFGFMLRPTILHLPTYQIFSIANDSFWRQMFKENCHCLAFAYGMSVGKLKYKWIIDLRVLVFWRKKAFEIKRINASYDCDFVCSRFYHCVYNNLFGASHDHLRGRDLKLGGIFTYLVPNWYHIPFRKITLRNKLTI